MLIRTATGTDAREIAHVHVETWRAAYRGQVPDAFLEKLDMERRTAFFQERLKADRGEVFVVEVGDENLPVALGDGELHGVDVEMRLHLGQHLVEHEHHEHALLGPFGRLRIDRRVGPSQREHPVRRKRPPSIEKDARQRLRAQPLDRIAVDAGDDGHVGATLRARMFSRHCPSERPCA